MGRRIPLGLGFESPFSYFTCVANMCWFKFWLKGDWVGCKIVSMLMIVGCNVQRYSLQSILLILFVCLFVCLFFTFCNFIF
jgi:hypothetical protein